MMVYNVTVEQIRSWPVDKNGWHVDPETKTHIKLGNDVRLGDSVTLGDYVRVGDGVTLGDYVRVGDGVTLGNYVRLGDSVTLDNGVRLIHTPIYIQGRKYWIGYCGKPGWIRSGCIEKPIEWWLENVERCAEENGYTPDEQAEYRLHVEHVAAWMKLYKVATKGEQ